MTKIAALIKPQYVIEQICEQTKGEAIITTGVGQNQMWTAQFYKFKRPRQFITSGGLGTMGYGLPAAIGAQIAKPDQVVIDIDGDHSFNMTMTELSTAVQHKLPIKVCIINNGYMGMVRQWQELFYQKGITPAIHSRIPTMQSWQRRSAPRASPLNEKAEVPKAIKKMLGIKDKPCLVDFRVEKEENVWPMVPAGKSLARDGRPRYPAEPYLMKGRYCI